MKANTKRMKKQSPKNRNIREKERERERESGDRSHRGGEFAGRRCGVHLTAPRHHVRHCGKIHSFKAKATEWEIAMREKRREGREREERERRERERGVESVLE